MPGPAIRHSSVRARCSHRPLRPTISRQTLASRLVPHSKRCTRDGQRRPKHKSLVNPTTELVADTALKAIIEAHPRQPRTEMPRFAARSGKLLLNYGNGLTPLFDMTVAMSLRWASA